MVKPINAGFVAIDGQPLVAERLAQQCPQVQQSRCGRTPGARPKKERIQHTPQPHFSRFPNILDNLSDQSQDGPCPAHPRWRQGVRGNRALTRKGLAKGME